MAKHGISDSDTVGGLVESYTYPILKPLVQATLANNISVMLWGHPGVGKSTLAYELAADAKLPIVDIRLSHVEPSDIAGLMYPDREKGMTVRMRPDWLTLDKPFLLFLDEINAGVSKLHLSAAYQIILERRIGPWKFHKDTQVVAAGNYEDDAPGVITPIPLPLRNRFAQFGLAEDVETFINYAMKKDISPDILAFLKFRPEMLFKITGESAFPTPRTWEKAGILYVAGQGIGKGEKRDLTWKRLVSSVLGSSATSEFYTYLKVYRTVDVDAILEGKYPDIPSGKVDLLCAVVFALAHHVSNKTLKDTQFKHLSGFFNVPNFSREFQVMFFKKLMENKPAVFNVMLKNTYMQPIIENLQRFMGEDK